MDEKNKILINIYGGTNVIAPVATTVGQYFHNDRLAGVSASSPEPPKSVGNLTDDERRLLRYVPDVSLLRRYVKLIGNCTTAHELAGVVSVMLTDAVVKRETVVKAAFIEVLLPFADRLTSGAKVDNVRQQINNMLAERGRR